MHRPPKSSGANVSSAKRWRPPKVSWQERCEGRAETTRCGEPERSATTPDLDRYLVTFPRSGHHLLEGLIEKVFGLLGYEYSYCEYYGCCQTSPCRVAKILQGTHDFELDLELDGSHAVVLYRRDPIRQLDAWFRWWAGQKYGEYDHLLRHNSNWWIGARYEQRLASFIREHSEFYSLWVQKWTGTPRADVKVVDYYDLVDNPRQILTEALAHLFPGFAIPQAVLDRLNLKDVRVINRMPDALHERLEKALPGFFPHGAPPKG